MSQRPVQVLFAKYNAVRRPEFRVATEMCEDAEGRFVQKRATEEAAKEHLEKIFQNAQLLQDYYREIKVIVPTRGEDGLRFPFIKGKTLAEQIQAGKLNKEDFIALVNQKLETALSVQELCQCSFELTEEFEKVFGKTELGKVPALCPANIDGLFSNLIENETGIYCIDCEWVCNFPVPVDFIRYRILLYLYVTQLHTQLNGVTAEEMFRWFGITEEQQKTFWQMDDHFQQYVHGENRKYVYPAHYLKKSITVSGMNETIQAQEEYISAQKKIIHDKDVHIEDLEKVRKQELHDKDVYIDDLGKIIHDKDVHIADLERTKKQELHDKDVHITDLEKTVQEKDKHIGALDQIICDKNEHIANLGRIREKELHDKDVHIQNQDARIEQLTRDYETVTNAFFWKVTKPARALSDKLKTAGKKNEHVYLCLRTGKDLLRHGLRYAVKNRRAYLASKRNARLVSSWPSEEEQAKERKVRFPKAITFSILVPLYNTPDVFLREMIESVQKQTYSRWELCLADGSDDAHPDVGITCEKYARKDHRIRYRKLEKNLGISGNTNACIEMATGDYIALFDHDDVLHPSALHEMMKAICEQEADFVYTDEVTFESPDLKKLITLHYKPDFAPDNLLANNYICHFSAFSAELLKKTGGFRHEYDGSQDHDMILRLTEAAKKVVHIPKILYWWRSHPQSVSQDINAKGYAVDSAKRAVHDFLRDYKNVETVIESTRAFPTIFRIRYPLREQAKISIVIPNKDHLADLKRCIDSILTKTTYSNYEIVIAENNSETQEIFDYYAELEQKDNIRVLRYPDAFNYSKINNWAVRQCDGEYILLLNNDTEVITPDWLENMLMYAQREDVGAVGAKLYLPDGRIQHAGVVIKMGDDRIAAHAYYGAGHDHIGYMGRLCYAQDFSAVTAACLMIRKSKYDEVGGLDEGFAVAYNDIDFCLKLRKAGYLNIFTPFTELNHHESASRGYETGEKLERFKREVARFREKWGETLEAGDPYFNPNLSLDSPMFEPW